MTLSARARSYLWYVFAVLLLATGHWVLACMAGAAGWVCQDIAIEEENNEIRKVLSNEA